MHKVTKREVILGEVEYFTNFLLSNEEYAEFLALEEVSDRDEFLYRKPEWDTSSEVTNMRDTLVLEFITKSKEEEE